MEIRKITYLGFNNFKTHKRGVENVIHFQSQASKINFNYYLHWDVNTCVSRYENLICIGIKKNFFWFIYLNVILFKLNKKSIIFIHSHNPLMSIVSIYQSNLLTVHDGLYYLTGVNKHKLNKLFWLIEKILYLRCNYIHFISEYSKKMSLYKSHKNYTIIYNTSHFEKSKFINSFQERSIDNFSNNVYKILTVRSIEERALINLVIEVAHKLKHKNIHFYIAGKGPLLNYYGLQIKNLGLNNITLMGYVSDNQLIQYYKDCNLVLVPAAFGEGFGLPIIEGYLFDKPVIASNVCAIPEVIINTNFLFDNNIDSLISRIDYVSTILRFDYKNYYDSKFANDTIALAIGNLYKKLM